MDEADFYFDDAAAARAVNFFPDCLCHVKGEKAGTPFVLHESHAKIIRDLFGWRRRSDHTRRYRKAYVEIPRKNAKSTLAAGIALYLLLCDGEQGGEVYSAASTRDQASLVFGMAADMVKKSHVLGKHVMLRESTKRMLHRKSQSFYRAISADHMGAHGFNASGIIFDELHTQPDRNLWDVLDTSTGARKQPLTFAITTAGHDRLRAVSGCEMCYADIPERRQRKGSVFCSGACEAQYRQIRSPVLRCICCAVCQKSVAILHMKGSHKYCSPACFAKRKFKMTAAEYQSHATRNCKQCNAQFESTARRFCSAGCCRQYHRAELQKRRAAGESKKQYACTVCGARGAKRQCSDHCRAIARAGNCESCGCDVQKTGRQRFCETCATARKNRSDNVRGRQRRAKTKTVRVTMTPQEIWERDGGRCGLCLKKIDIGRKWPDKMALAIDHIVPLSKGGEDTPENLQATHAKCNSRKNNKGGSQRRLFG